MGLGNDGSPPEPPAWPGPHGWAPPPRGTPPWQPPARPPARFSGLCAGGLAAAVAPVLVLTLAGREAIGYALTLSAFAAVLSGAALVMTLDEQPTNRWMAIVGLAGGLAPFALMLMLMAVFTELSGV